MNFVVDLSYLFREGVYGDVHRVKILFNKKDNALIQMAEPHQAQLGMYMDYSNRIFTLLTFCSMKWVTPDTKCVQICFMKKKKFF